MGNAKPKSSVEQDENNQSLGELEQLRAIIFGQAQQQLTQRMAEVESHFTNQVNMLSTTIEQRFTQLTQSIESLKTDIHQQLARQDDKQESYRAELIAITENLGSSLEIAETAAKSDADSLEAHMAKELESLDNQLMARIAQLEERFSLVSTELSASKTDRKTLADLLAGMATQLATDKP